jgi:uncharacterized membrane protein YfcA
MLLALPLGLAVGACLGLLGGGGAVLAVPALVYVLGQDPHTATTTSLIVVLLGATFGAIGHSQNRRVCWRHAAAFVPTAAIGVAAGTLLNRGVDGTVLLLALVPVLLAAAAATWRRAGSREAAAAEASARGCPPPQPIRLGAAGLGTGVLTGFLGVGGGFVIVPVLTVFLGFPLRLAMGTSVVAIAALSILGLTAHVVAGASLEAGATVLLSAACMAGALLAARHAARVPEHLLARGFAVLVMAVATGLSVAAVA